MTNKNTALGGTDWVDGEILYAADLNDTFDVLTNGAPLYIDITNNRLGIGTSSPTEKLDVLNGNITMNKGYSLQLGGDANAEIRVDDAPAWSTRNNVMTFKTYDVAGTTGAWIFRGSNTGTNFMSILGSGYVGIGTSSPAGKLEVENAGTDPGIFIDQNGNGISLNIDSEATTANAIALACLGTGAGMLITQAGAGYGLDIDQNGAADGIHIDMASGSLKGIDMTTLGDTGMQIYKTGGAGYGIGIANSGGTGDSLHIYNTVDEWCVYLSQDGDEGGLHISMDSPTVGGASKPAIDISMSDSTCWPLEFSSTSPTSPANGAFWYDGSNLKFRTGGTTYTLTMS